MRAARHLAWLEHARSRPGFIKEDISEGKELVNFFALSLDWRELC